jgi:hypothetical protein
MNLSRGSKEDHKQKDFDLPHIEAADPLFELNKCAINSQANEHTKALIHAERAIQILE